MITVDTMSTATLTARSDRLRDSVLALAGVPPSDVASGACLPPLARELSIMSGCIVVLHFAPHSSICLSSSSSFLSSPSISDSFTQFFFYRSTSSLHALHSFTSIYSSPTHLITRLASILLLTASCSSTPPPPSLHAHSLNSAHSTRHSLARSHSRQNNRHTNNHQERKKGEQRSIIT